MCDSELSGLHPFDNMAKIHQIKNRSKQKGRLWAHETPFFEVIFVTLTENSSFVTNDTQEPHISTPTKVAVGTHFHVRHGTKTTPVFFTCWWRSLLVTTSKFSLLTIRWHSATRDHLLLYPQGDRSGLRKPKKIKNHSNHTNQSYHQHWSP